MEGLIVPANGNEGVRMPKLLKEFDNYVDKLNLSLTPFLNNPIRNINLESKFIIESNKSLMLLMTMKKIILQMLEEKKKELNLVGPRLDKYNQLVNDITLLCNNSSDNFSQIIKYIEENL